MSQILAVRQVARLKAAKLEKENENLKKQLNQLRALSNIGLSCSMIGHEINNILTPIGNYAQLAMGNPQDDALTEKAQQKAINGCNRASQLLQNIAAMVSEHEDEKENHCLKKMTERVFDCLSRDFSKDGIKVNLNIDDGLNILCLAADIEHLMMNLILNARDAMLGRGGILTISAQPSEQGTVIEVSDNGCGIDSETLSQIFNPFFTTKTKGHGKSGTGLGLAFCKEIVESYDGIISVKSKVGMGTTFRITLPENA